MSVSPISSSPPVEQFPPVVPYDETPRNFFLERTVRWVKDHFSAPLWVKKIVWCTLAVFANIVTLGCLLPLTFRIKDLSRRIDMEKAAANFYKEVELLRNAAKIQEPPEKEPIVFKSSKRSFNHVNEYAIESDILWYRQKSDPRHEWKPLFFDGWMEKKTPQLLSVDGANMVVVDNVGQVHYRKILIEGRGFQEVNKHRFLRHLKGDHKELPTLIQKGTYEYLAIDLTRKINWKADWYNFPGVKRIVNAISGNRLTSHGIISHRGKFNKGHHDAKGDLQETDVGVTTLYELQSDKHTIRKFDPWAPMWAKVSMNLPESEHTVFQAESFDVSSSTLCAMGYDVNDSKEREPQAPNGELKLYTNLFDIDTGGGNPGLHYAYAAEGKKPKNFIILEDKVENDGWVEHTLPTEAQAKELYNQMSIIQTGIGNNAREIRVAGSNAEGKVGYFFKKTLAASEWDFKEAELVQVDTLKVLSRTRHVDVASVPRWTHQYKSRSKEAPLRLSHFGSGTYHSTLAMRFGVPEKSYDLPLNIRLGFGTFLGLKHLKYELVLPEDLVPKDDPLLKAFGNRRIISLGVKTRTHDGKTVLHLSASGRHPPFPPLEIET